MCPLERLAVAAHQSFPLPLLSAENTLLLTTKMMIRRGVAIPRRLAAPPAPPASGQRSAEWHALRANRLTASAFHRAAGFSFASGMDERLELFVRALRPAGEAGPPPELRFSLGLLIC